MERGRRIEKRWREAAGLIGLFALLVGPGCAVRLVPPSQGGPAWVELTSAHFVMKTDLEPAVARERLRELEEFWQVLRRHAFRAESGPAGVTHVVCLRSQGEYRALGHETTGGHFSRFSGPYGVLEPAVVMPCDEEATSVTLKHELTHRFVTHHFPAAPVWLNEGLAEFYERAEVRDGVLTLGLGPEYRLRVPSVGGMPTGAEIRALEPARFYAGQEESEEAELSRIRSYLGAWGLVHSLVLADGAQRERFWSYLERLAVADASSQAAWDWAFDDVAEQQLDAAYSALFGSSEITTARLPVAGTQVGSVSVRTLGSPEVLALWSLHRDGSGSKEQRSLSDADLAQALEQEPRLVEARLFAAERAAARGDLRRAGIHLEAAVRENPLDERALAGLLLHRVAERRAAPRLPDDGALRKLGETLAKVARRALGLRALSELEIVDGDAALAVQLAERATKADLSCSRCYDTLAEASYKAGLPRAAIQAQRFGLHLRPEGEPAPDAEARLKFYEEALRKKAPGIGRN